MLVLVLVLELVLLLVFVLVLVLELELVPVLVRVRVRVRDSARYKTQNSFSVSHDEALHDNQYLMANRSRPSTSCRR